MLADGSACAAARRLMGVQRRLRIERARDVAGARRAGTDRSRPSRSRLSRRGPCATSSTPRGDRVVARDRRRGVRGCVEYGAVELGHEARRRSSRCGMGAAGTERGARGAGPDGAECGEALDRGFAAALCGAEPCGCGGRRTRAMLHLNGQLPDVMGATFEATIQQFTEQASRARVRGGTASSTAPLMHWSASASRATPVKTRRRRLAPRPVVQVHAPEHGPAEIAGIPIADSLLEQLRGQREYRTGAGRRRRCTGGGGEAFHRVLTEDRAGGAAARRVVPVRELCAPRRARGPPPARPGRWGGTDDLANLAAVCSTHHRLLVPHGGRVLIGNPNQPDGLRTVHLHDLTPEHANSSASHHPRAGPNAA